MAKGYKAEDLLDSIVTEQEITCSICKKSEREYNIDDYDFADTIFEDGWRATPNYVYCPDCASKKLKQ